MKSSVVVVALILAGMVPAGDVHAKAQDSFESVWLGWGNADSEKCRTCAAGRPAFDEMAAELVVRPVENVDQGDGTWSYDLTRISSRLGAKAESSFFINLRSRTPIRARDFYFRKFRHDARAYRIWKERYPKFRGFLTLEWVNDALLPQERPAGMMASRRGKNALTRTELDEVLARNPPARNRDEFVNRTLRNHFNRLVEYSFDDPGAVAIGDGAENAQHLAAYWGAGVLAIETTRDHYFYQNQMMFCRGAARQFERPWLWYVASYIDGYQDGKYISNCLLAEESPRWPYHGPQYGISLSAVRRTTYMTYLSGANYYERESMVNTHFLKETGPAKLSEEGRVFEEFSEFVRTTDRGEPYQPFALLVPANRGYSRAGGRAWRRFEYTHGDYMLDAVMSTVLEAWANNDPADIAQSQERVMANSRYGDFYDAITPDFTNDLTFAKALSRYKAAILIGEYGENAGMERTILDWVSRGGELALSSAQVTSGFAAAVTNARPVRCDSNGSTVYSEAVYGRGRIVLAARPYMTEWAGDDEASQKQTLKGVGYHGTRRFPEIEWLLDRMTERHVPVKVSGDRVQYGLNRTKEGYLVYLINNAGVTKIWNEYPKFSEKPARVTVELGTFRETVEIPSGDLRILRIRTSEETK